jgi:hypothetical protein
MARKKNIHAQRLQKGIATSEDAAVLGRIGGRARVPKGFALMSPAKRKRIAKAASKRAAEARQKGR